MGESFFFNRYRSPLGTYVLVSSQLGVVCIESETHAAIRFARWRKGGIQLRDGNDHNQRVIAELDAYFAGTLFKFSIPLDLRGTDFQRKVWGFLLNIPYGETRSYGQIARALGQPSASRAVGRAIGANPISIVVPCHRVIGASGKLVGYGGGLNKKRVLLDLEARAMRNRSESRRS